MKDNLYIIRHEENVICVLENRADAEEMLMDIYMEALYETFCEFIIEGLPVQLALRVCSHGGNGYWFEEVPSLVHIGNCATCNDGSGPFTTHGIREKCYCKRNCKYEKSTHYCAEWKEKRNASECGRPDWPSGESGFRTSLDEII